MLICLRGSLKKSAFIYKLSQRVIEHLSEKYYDTFDCSYSLMDDYVLKETRGSELWRILSFK